MVQNKKNFTALIKDRLLAFEPPSTVQNPKFGAGLFSRCEEGLNLGLSSFCGFGEVCMSRVCGWVGGVCLYLFWVCFHVRRRSYHGYPKLNVNHLQRVLSVDDLKKLKEFLVFEHQFLVTFKILSKGPVKNQNLSVTLFLIRMWQSPIACSNIGKWLRICGTWQSRVSLKSQWKAQIARVNFREQNVLEKIKFVTRVTKQRPVVSSTSLCSCGYVDSDTITTIFCP